MRLHRYRTPYRPPLLSKSPGGQPSCLRHEIIALAQVRGAGGYPDDFAGGGASAFQRIAAIRMPGRHEAMMMEQRVTVRETDVNPGGRSEERRVGKECRAR